MPVNGKASTAERARLEIAYAAQRIVNYRPTREQMMTLARTASAIVRRGREGAEEIARATAAVSHLSPEFRALLASRRSIAGEALAGASQPESAE